VLHNLRVCDPKNNKNDQTHVPMALEALYGEILANYVAVHTIPPSWKQIPLASELAAALRENIRWATKYPVEDEFPRNRLATWAMAELVRNPVPRRTSRVIAASAQEQKRTIAVEVAGRQAYNPSYNCHPPREEIVWALYRAQVRVVSIDQVRTGLLHCQFVDSAV
jgi:hypothetical protein